MWFCGLKTANTLTSDDAGGAKWYGTLVEQKGKARVPRENPAPMQLYPFKVLDGLFWD
jgi:hypothetical protein